MTHCGFSLFLDSNVRSIQRVREIGGNPVLRSAGEKPVAVLNHNRPAFYMVTPKLFEALVEELADLNLMELARQRLSRKDTAI